MSKNNVGYKALTADSPVNVTPVSYANDQHQENFPLYLVENPVLTDAQSIKLPLALDLLYLRRVRIVRERIDPLLYSSPYRSIQRSKIFRRPRCELDPVCQLEAQLFFDLCPRYGAFFLRFG